MAQPARTVAIPQRTPLPFMGVSLRKRSAFYTQLARMLNAGIGVQRCLTLLAGQGGSRRLSRAAGAMAEHVGAGNPLAGAFALHPNLFPANEVRVIEGAGLAGREPEAMLHIAHLLDRLALARGRVVAGLIYPVCCLLAAFVGLPLVITYVLGGPEPALKLLLGQLGSAGTFAAIALAVYVAFHSIPEGSALKSSVHAIALRVPLFGKQFRRLALARFADTFQSLYGAGLMLPEAMARAAMACGNAHIGGRILRVAPQVSDGGSVTQALAQTGVIPLIGLNLLETGEAAGKLDASLQKFAQYQHEDLEIGIERLARILPMIALFLMILILASAVLSAWGAYIGSMTRLTGG